MNPPSIKMRRRLALRAIALSAAVLLTACGDSGDPDPASAPTIGVSADDTEPVPTVVASGQVTVTACELFPEAEAEALIGADLALIAASDNFRCSYDGGVVDGEAVGALLSISPFVSDADDLAVVREALDPATIEDLPGLGDAAFYHDAGAVHDVQFVKNGVWVIVAVSGVVGSDDARAAEMQIAQAAATRL